MKMELTQCSETSAYKIQTPGNYPEENILQTPGNYPEENILQTPGITQKKTYFRRRGITQKKTYFRRRGIAQKKTYNMEDCLFFISNLIHCFFGLRTISAIFFPLHVSGLTGPSSGGLNCTCSLWYSPPLQMSLSCGR